MQHSKTHLRKATLQCSFTCGFTNTLNELILYVPGHRKSKQETRGWRLRKAALDIYTWTVPPVQTSKKECHGPLVDSPDITA